MRDQPPRFWTSPPTTWTSPPGVDRGGGGGLRRHVLFVSATTAISSTASPPESGAGGSPSPTIPWALQAVPGQVAGGSGKYLPSPPRSKEKPDTRPLGQPHPAGGPPAADHLRNGHRQGGGALSRAGRRNGASACDVEKLQELYGSSRSWRPSWSRICTRWRSWRCSWRNRGTEAVIFCGFTTPGSADPPCRAGDRPGAGRGASWPYRRRDRQRLAGLSAHRHGCHAWATMPLPPLGPERWTI